MDVLVTKPTEEQKKKMETQPIWEHDAGSFPWKYEEKQETCLIIEGKGSVEGPEGEKTCFEAGDLVRFPTHWDCTWNIEEKIRKHYVFDTDI